MTNPESSIAQQLELSKSSAATQALTSRRMASAVSLAAQLKEAPKNQHPQLISEFAMETERLAFEVLDESQRARLSKLRVQWLGMVSLADDQIAQALNLAEWQREMVAQAREQLRSARRSNEEDRVKPQIERAIRNELSDSQWAAWRVIAGLSDEPLDQPPMPPQRSAELAEPSAAQPEATADQATSEAAMVPIEQVQLTLNFQRHPWET